jgi:RNA polymerase sigma-70 factor (ECF subfamily)
MDAVEFDAWVGPHVAVLRAVAIREVGPHDADDVVQDTLVRAWRRRSTYRADLGSAKAWLVAILLDQVSRRRTRTRLHLLVALNGSGVVADNTRTGDRLDVEDAVRQLPRRQREVITLFYLADLSVEEVAGVLGITPGSVKSHLFDARSALRSALEKP